jgi:1-deoxy-D-xylulose-5-phosphate reductoisomerase
VASHPESDLAVSAIVGAKGLIPTLAALQSGQDIALANKESMVTAGELIGREAKRAGVRILPIDSEHSAIFQALAGNRRNEVRRVILTASGGPFLNHSRAERERATPESAIRHPRWNMGKKISVDSATLMNKGLEVIEAKWFFDLGWNEIEVLIHPQSIVHSMVEYIDGSVIAQLGIPDMRGPISYALGYPERVPLGFSSLDLTRVSGLTFAAPDLREFPCLSFGYEALRAGGTMPAVLNAANEEAVAAFLNHQIGFLKIEEVISRTMEGHRVGRIQEISDVLYADQWARKEALRAIEKIQGKA